METGSFYPAHPAKLSDLKRKRRLAAAEKRVESSNLHPATLGISQLNPKAPTSGSEDTFVFTVQNLALDKAVIYPDYRVFSFEIASDGRRHFLAGPPTIVFWKIKRLKRHKRHWYEVIGQRCPCKLYFDIEFHRDKNPDRPGSQIVAQLKDLLIAYIRLRLGFILELSDILDLESSTNNKFSRHLIINLPGERLFENNLHVGVFVREFISSLTEEERRAITFWDKQGDKCELFIDLSVYSKNRNFRTYLSSKFDRQSCLVLSESSHRLLSDLSDKDIFLKSLITWTENPHADKIKIPGAVQVTLVPNDPSIKVRSTSATPANHRSLFPEVDHFIEGIIKPGFVRKIEWKASLMTLEYEIQGYRYCYNVRRWHRSNNIKYIVLLNRGVYFQMCHDPDCQDFKSEDLKLPLNTQPWVQLFDDEDPFETDNDRDFEDELLLSIYDKVVNA
ncbi:hypothetical protein TCAL_10609 [Tigriopus californicus]|uniref:DNA-directed primase/polymerase protein n=1 Tax=Tigriopus californicus TaxID=6832 RepID=A0A553P387_TIGCA|nr:DNA-directed primase/polymerase protein-like [Tigriopus californicus]TRY72139.1 hypothetical protein TCAL_10609 [Tigriopus californicus]|eukprot:TCALIF_10609-PA protein Name:"Similar to primpol DNA-directed primase/polymerase protein (Danio rerio)" AED:0.09 eAED:0.09 QI:0/-1/0/1/-1/1/1/0/446